MPRMTVMEAKNLTGLPYVVVTVLVAVSEGKKLTDDVAVEAKAITKLGYLEVSPDAPSGFVVTAAGRQKLSEICNRCGRPLSPKGHCHPCIEDKLLLEKYPSAAISMHNAFGSDKP